MNEGLKLKKHIPIGKECKKCGKKTKQTHKETEKLHIYKCIQCNNVEWDKKSKKDMKTIKLKESDLTNIVKRIVNEASNPKVKHTIEPPERNVGKNTFVKTKIVKKPDPLQIRREITQNVIERIKLYGDDYIFELDKLNANYPIKSDPYKQY